MPMRLILCIMIAPLLMPLATAWAQLKPEVAKAIPLPAQTPVSANPYAGSWTYRSYVNRPDVIVDNDPQKAIGLIFGEGVMTLEMPIGNAFKGTLNMGGGYILDLSGTILGGPATAPPVLRISGIGRSGTPTDGWDYEYVGYLAWTWPNGIGQIPAIVGTVVRATQHGQGKAGFVASFIATKQQ